MSTSTFDPNIHRTVRLSKPLTDEVIKIAKGNKRSLVSQIEIILEKELKRRGIEV